MNSGFAEPSGRSRSPPNAHLPRVPRMEFPTNRSIRMMTSVSILPRMIGAAIAVSLLKDFGMSALHRPHVGNGAHNRRGSSRRRARQMGPGTRSLTADKIAIGRRDRALPRRHRLAIGGKAHRAAGLAPFEAGVDENLVEALSHCVALDRLGARHNPGPHTRRDLATPHDLGGCPQVAQTA